jgi:hypothetical protein
MRIPTWTDWEYCNEEVRAVRVERILERPTEYTYNVATDSFHPNGRWEILGNSGPKAPGDPPSEIYAPADAVEAAHAA